MLLVGRHGVGKTSLLRAATGRLEELSVFEAAATQLQAGAVYVGELEARVKEFVDNVRGKPMIWHLPVLEAALYAGQHTQNRFGMLDALLPAVEAGELTIVAEASPEAAERLLAERPHLATSFQLVQVRPLDEADAVAVAQHALEHDGYDVTASDETLRGAFELGEQFLPRIASPGNLLRDRSHGEHRRRGERRRRDRAVRRRRRDRQVERLARAAARRIDPAPARRRA